MARLAVDGVDGLRVDGACLAEICERYGVAELSVFGSVAQGRATSASDLDLLYVMRSGRSLGFAINRLEDELEELFGRRVDLVSKRAVHWMMRDTVLAEARTLYAAHPAVPWADASRTRNRIVHGYWSVDFDLLTAIALDDLPSFLDGVRSTLAVLGDDPHGDE